MRSRILAIASGLALVFTLLASGGVAAGAASGARAAPPAASQGAAPALQCAGGSGPVKHVIYVQFDNTHLLRPSGRPL